jgi:hypothetical protein
MSITELPSKFWLLTVAFVILIGILAETFITGLIRAEEILLWRSVVVAVLMTMLYVRGIRDVLRSRRREQSHGEV